MIQHRTTPTPILKPAHNCWRLEKAGRVAFLVDGAAYYKAFRNAIQQAKHSILILGWDINSRLKLLRGESSGPLPTELADFLSAVVSRRRDLQAHVLTWDFAMIYAMEREWLPIYQLGWRTNHRLHFEMDGQHPIGAAHHQKVVVVDDVVAFAGGLDLSKCRWDTPEHRPHDERRIDPDGVYYPPFHDVQMLVDGPAAAALGDLARERWYRATGQRLKPLDKSSPNDPWPAEFTPDLQNVSIAIARTEPKFKSYPEVREVEQLYLDAIAAAQHWIYIENQYFTSYHIGEALAARLEKANGPEVVLVLPRKTGGWLEHNTMDALRGQALKRLHEADKYHRLRTYYPFIPGLEDQCLMVHAKVLVVDDRLVRVGSSNLSNRSMGLDTECDLAFEATDNDSTAAAISQFRNRLLGEHLDVEPLQIAHAIEREGSLIAAIKALHGPTRTLRELDRPVSTELDELIPQMPLIDPECALDPERLADEIIPPEQRQPARRQLLFGTLMLIVPLALAAAWHWTPLGEWLDAQKLATTLSEFKEYSGAPFLVFGVYLLAGLIAVPVVLLITATVLIFGPLHGFAYALIGALLSAILIYGVGHFLGRSTIRRLAGVRLNQISRRLAQSGILTILAIRLIPIAPFTVVNLVIGASHIRLRDFILGTLFGLIPGILGIALFIDGVAAIIHDPTSLTVGILAAIIVAIGLGVLGIRWWLLKRDQYTAAKVPDRS